MNYRFFSRPARQGFTLIELIAVIAIIGIVAVFVVPAASTMIRGSQLTQGSQMLTDQISLARQQALSKNKSVEVRFIQYANPEIPGETVTDPTTGHFRAIQLLEVSPSGIPVPIGKLQTLPAAVMMNPSGKFSSLINTDKATTPQVTLTTPTAQDPSLPRGVTNHYNYVAFRFLPDGSTNLLASSSFGWYVTLHDINDQTKVSSGKPADLQKINFYTLQIDPVSGSTRGYRPQAQ